MQGLHRSGTKSSPTLRWREMDSNYWSRHGETPLGRAHVVSADGSTSSERH